MVPCRLENIEFIHAISDAPLYLASGDLGAATSAGTVGEGRYKVPTTPVSAVQGLQPHVLIVDCEGCFDTMLATIDAAALLKHTRTIVIENDAWHNPTQMDATHATLNSLGFEPTVCVANPIIDGPHRLLHGCFWSVLQRTAGGLPPVTKLILRGKEETMAAFQERAEPLVSNSLVEDVSDPMHSVRDVVAAPAPFLSRAEASAAAVKATPCSTSTPCAQVFAAYWPQWHPTPLNDYWFGTNYTDWDLLCQTRERDGGRNDMGEQLVHPLPYGPEGFGYYNLLDREVRRRQALLAKEHGVHGFAIYHYHFGPQAYGLGNPGADMDETTMKLLDAADGEVGSHPSPVIRALQ